MKIDLNRIPQEGLVLEEEILTGKLGLDSQAVRLCGPLAVRAEAFMITNALSVDLKIRGSLETECSRCLEKIKLELNKQLKLNYALDKGQTFIELDDEIKTEVFLDYPVKPLCRTDCRGLCPRCGGNLNQGGCSCAVTEKKTL